MVASGLAAWPDWAAAGKAARQASASPAAVNRDFMQAFLSMVCPGCPSIPERAAGSASALRALALRVLPFQFQARFLARLGLLVAAQFVRAEGAQRGDGHRLAGIV